MTLGIIGGLKPLSFQLHGHIICLAAKGFLLEENQEYIGLYPTMSLYSNIFQHYIMPGIDQMDLLKEALKKKNSSQRFPK
jgi:hypothetical protein